MNLASIASRVAVPGGVVAAACFVGVHHTADRLATTGAIPASEFEMIAPLYAGRPLFLLIAGVLLIAGLARGTPPVRGITAFVLLALFWRPALPYAAVAAGGVFVWQQLRAPSETTPADTETGWRSTLLWAAGVFIALVAAGTIVGLIDALVFTRRFVPDFVASTDFRSYVVSIPLRASALAVHLLRDPGWIVLAVLVIGAALVRWGRISAALVAPVIGGSLVTTLVSRFVYRALDDEILQVEVGGALITLVVGVAVFVAARAGRSVTGSGFLGRVGGSMTSAFRLPRLSVPAGAAVMLAVLLAGAMSLLYPGVEDYRTEMFDALVPAAVVILAGMIGVAASRSSARVKVTIASAVTVSVVISFFGSSADPRIRVAAHEYSRFGDLRDARDPRADHPILGTATAFESLIQDPVPEAQGAAESTRPLIIVVLWDAARHDRMSAYGYQRQTTPNVERLARRAVVFETARSLATATTLGVRQLMTGRYASRYMLAQDHPPFLLKELAGAGYDRFVITVTGSDMNGVSAEAFHRGWDADRAGLRYRFFRYENEDSSKPDERKTDDVVAELDRLRVEPGGLSNTFVYLHLTGTHSPWPNDDPVKDWGNSLSDRYDGEMSKVDRLLGVLLDHLEEWGELDRSVIVLTADHGTGLGDHGRYAGFLPYEEQTRVPLIISAPGVAPRRVTDSVACIDVAPTLLELAAPRAARPYHGRSLVPLLSGVVASLPPRPVVVFNAFRDAYAVIGAGGRYKLYHDRARGYEWLRDLDRDPLERTCFLATEPDVAVHLRGLLASFLEEGKGRWDNPYHYRRR